MLAKREREKIDADAQHDVNRFPPRGNFDSLADLFLFFVFFFSPSVFFFFDWLFSLELAASNNADRQRCQRQSAQYMSAMSLSICFCFLSFEFLSILNDFFCFCSISNADFIDREDDKEGDSVLCLSCFSGWFRPAWFAFYWESFWHWPSASGTFSVGSCRRMTTSCFLKWTRRAQLRWWPATSPFPLNCPR